VKSPTAAQAPSTRPPRCHYAWIILAVATLVVFGSLGLARFGYTMLLPAMQKELLLDNTMAGGLATANLTGYLVLSVIGGALAVRFGPRTVISAGLALAAGGMLLTGLTNNFAGALAWRALTGIGSGASNVPVMALLAAWFVPRRRGLAAGIAVTGSSLALMVLGPLVPRILTSYEQSGWRVCWFLFAGVTLGLAVLACAALRNRPSLMELRPLGAAAEEEISISEPGTMSWNRVYRSKIIWHISLIYIAFGFSYIIYMTFFTKYLIAEGGYTQVAAGRLFMHMGWLSLLCGLIWGWVSDIIGRKGALIIVSLLHTVSFGLFALWPAPPGFTISAILFGLSAWSIPAIMAAACGDLLGPRLAPAGLGFITLFFGIGQAIGPSAAGAVADATGSLAPAFMLAAGAALLGAIGAVLLRHPGLTRVPHKKAHT